MGNDDGEKMIVEEIKIISRQKDDYENSDILR